MVKRRRIQSNESSQDEEGDIPQLISSKDTANEGVDRGLNEAGEITPRRRKSKKGTVSTWGDVEKSRLEICLKHISCRLRRFSRGCKTLVSWTLISEEECKLIADAVKDKKVTATTFKECINTYLQNEREGYIANLRELSPKASRRDKVEVQRRIEADYPTNTRDLLDEIHKECPTETATCRDVVTTRKNVERPRSGPMTTTKPRHTPENNPDSNRLKQVNFKRRRDSPKNGRTLVNSQKRSGFQEESPRQPPAKKGKCKINPTSSTLRTDDIKEQPITSVNGTQHISNRQTVVLVETLGTAELTSQSDVEVEHPSSADATPKKRVYKSRKHVQESTLSSQDKVNLRQKIREGTPYGQEIPTNEKPKRKRALEGLSCPERFKHFLDQPNLPTCKRWNVNRKIPIDEINHLGFNILRKYIDTLKSPDCTQQQYEIVNVAWPKVALAMMHTAKSYGHTTPNGFDITQSKITKRKKRMIRLQKRLTGAWKHRLNPSGKDKALLAKMRVEAKGKHMNVKGLLDRVKEEIILLENKEKREADKAEGRRIRSIYDKSGSMKTVLQAGMAKKVPVKEEEAVKFFKELLAHKETPPQLAIDEWVKPWTGRPITHDIDHIEEFLRFKLKYSRPFKTPGPNKVHPAAFKRFDSLASLLLEKVKGLLSGKFMLTDQDMTAQAFLLPKTVPPSSDPNDYRAINCINADMKYVNAVTYEFIYKNCFQYIATNQCAAFKGIPGTLHATMVNYSILKQNPKATSVLYVDMKKAFDSVSHSAMRKAVGALNLPASITKYIQGMLGSGGFTISNVDKTKSMKDKRVNVKRGIMQGCALAPCLFVIGMDIISYQLNKESMLPIGKNINSLPTDYMVQLNHKFQNESSIGHEEGETVADTPDSKHLTKRSETAMTNHISFVDDVKIFAKDNATIKRLKGIFESVALQLGLHVNAKKCGVLYNNKSDNVMLEDISELTDCYKYLGIPELGRSICVETLEKSLEKKILGSVCQVFKTKLNIGQKIKWFNSSIAPAIGYAVAHALPAVKQGILPSLCKRLDKLVIKILAGNITDSEQIEVRQQTTSIARLYCTPEKGGLGLRSLESVAYEAIVRHMANLWINPINEVIKGLSIQHELKGGKSTPIRQFTTLMKKFNIEHSLGKSGITIEGVYHDDVNEFTKIISGKIKDILNQRYYDKWIKKIEFAKAYDSLNLKMPWLKKAAISDLQANLITASQQQSLPGLNWHINKRNNIIKKCPLCQKELTTSHILSGCESNHARIKYITRHDAILASVTNSILKAIGTKYMPLCELRNLKECNMIGKDWSIGFDLPQLMEVGQAREQYEQVFEPLDDRRRSVKKIAHNRPDLVLVNHKLKKVILLEVAVVGNPWLLQQQVEIKRVRYMVNSQEVIGPDNYQIVNRAYNMNDHFKKKYGKDYQISFIPFIMGAYGEISPGFMEDLMKPLEVLMRKQHIKAMTENASRTAVVNTAYTVRYWLSMLQG